MTIQQFPIRVNKRTAATSPRRPVFVTNQLLLLSVALNVMTLVVVAHLSHTLLSLLQR